MASISKNGLINVPSRHSVEEAVQNVQRLLTAKGIKLFALIDHSGEELSFRGAARPLLLGLLAIQAFLGTGIEYLFLEDVRVGRRPCRVTRDSVQEAGKALV